MKKTILYNLIGILVAGGILGLCRLGSGYRHIENIVEGDYLFAKQHRHLPLEDRYAAKMGSLYSFYRYIKDNTPEDAVIYLPYINQYMEDASSLIFYSPHFSVKLWAVRFLYPRKVVTEQEYFSFGTVQPLTHVFVVGNGGRNILPYEVGDTAFAVFPICKSN